VVRDHPHPAPSVVQAHVPDLLAALPRRQLALIHLRLTPWPDRPQEVPPWLSSSLKNASWWTGQTSWKPLAGVGLTHGGWGSLSVGKEGVTVVPLDSMPVRSEVERGEIGWVDAYLNSESAFTTKLDPRMLRPAAPQPKLNRAARRGNRRRR
jgi:hypothetical protein